MDDYGSLSFGDKSLVFLLYVNGVEHYIYFSSLYPLKGILLKIRVHFFHYHVFVVLVFGGKGLTL